MAHFSQTQKVGQKNVIVLNSGEWSSVFGNQSF